MSGIINFIFDESQVDHKAHKPLNSLEINNGFRLRCTFCLRVCVHKERLVLAVSKHV